jgi:hypothetical protein
MSKKEKQKEKFKLNKLLTLISIILIISSVLVTKVIVIRPILWLLSIFLLAINIKKNNNYKTSSVIILSIIMLLSSIVIDGVIVVTLKTIPVFSYNIISTEKTRVYNSVGIRVWQCDKKNYKDLVVDPFYKKGYMCNAEDIEVMDINTFLNLVVQNHSEYKDSYIKIKGKISKKTGQNYLEMRSYIETDVKVNGYVEFADNITLRILFNEQESILDNYDVYDEITIVGVIKNMDTDANSNHVIYMGDPKVISTINLDEFDITVTIPKKCSKETTELYKTKDYTLYKYCIDEFIVRYPDGQYELPSTLSSGKMTIDQIYKNNPEVEKSTTDGSIIYRTEDYSVLVCDTTKSKDIYIGNKKMKFSNVKCKEIVEE